MPTPGQIAHLASLIGETCGLALPPINTAAVLRVYIRDLDLPEVGEGLRVSACRQSEMFVWVFVCLRIK